MGRAKLLYHDKARWPDSSLIEMTIWGLPTATDERPHGLKYSLYYGRGGERIVSYDNERGKGDHRHVRGQQFEYRFSDIDTLVADFLQDVKRERGIT
jgi:hypothetical protein